MFGKLISALATIGVMAAGVELTTGYVLIPGMGSLEEAFGVVGEIAIVLSGAFPMLAILTRILKKPIIGISTILKMNSASVSGLIATLANSIATFDMVKEMDSRGKVVNMAFAVSGAFVLGDHLAFTAGFEAEMITALIVGKLCAGITAVCVALFVARDKCEKR